MKKKFFTKALVNRIIFYIITLIVAMAYLIGGRMIARLGTYERLDTGYTSYIARVTSVEDTFTGRYHSSDVGETDATASVRFTAEIVSGDKKGLAISGVQQMEAYFSDGRKYVEEGDRILVMYSQDMSSEETWIWLEYVRTDVLIAVTVMFCVALVIFGHWKGVNTLVSLAYTCAIIFMVFIPAILCGQNAYLWSIATCFMIIMVTLLLVNGFTKKSFVAGVGCFAGVLASALLFIACDKLMYLTGVLNDESVYLLLMETTSKIDLKGIVFAGILIGAVGAIMDVAMSITASLFELNEKTGGLPAGEIIKSGITIGRDMMGTMANTLVLAYIGCDLSLVMLFMAYNTSLIELMNRELIVTEILQALTGSFGILLTIPLGSIICAMVLTGKKARAQAAKAAEEQKAQAADLPAGGTKFAPTNAAGYAPSGAVPFAAAGANSPFGNEAYPAEHSASDGCPHLKRTKTSVGRASDGGPSPTKLQGLRYYGDPELQRAAKGFDSRPGYGKKDL